MPSKLLRSAWFWFSIGWALIIFIGSVLPSIDLPSVTIWEADKLVHAIIYCVLTFGVAVTLIRNSVSIKSKAMRQSALLCLAYSISLELVQKFLPTRSFDLLDILANCTGTLLGVLLFLLVFRKK